MVTHSVARRASARTSCQVELRLVDDRALEQVDAEPAELGQLLAEEGGGDVEDRGRAVAAEGVAEAAADGGEQRLADAEERADAGHDHAGALVVLGVREAFEAGAEGRGECGRVVDLLAGRPAERERAVRCGPRRRRGRAASRGWGSRRDGHRRGPGGCAGRFAPIGHRPGVAASSSTSRNP